MASLAWGVGGGAAGHLAGHHGLHTRVLEPRLLGPLRARVALKTSLSEHSPPMLFPTPWTIDEHSALLDVDDEPHLRMNGA
jgi:hypothetical protein